MKVVSHNILDSYLMSRRNRFGLENRTDVLARYLLNGKLTKLEDGDLNFEIRPSDKNNYDLVGRTGMA